jgi:serine/threonine protein kinase
VSELRAALEVALGPGHRVQREVRPVGNCRLFVAQGEPTGPDLLVKVLPGELSLALDPAVFARELMAVAGRLDHPQLVPPLGAGRAGTSVYHTRPFVEGTTLRAWLVRYGELPLRRAVAVLRDVLAALAQAHGASIVHGDLKAENVLLVDDRALVADTGVVGAVARALPGDGHDAASAALCAAPYAAPERRGSPGDDMFAVGVLVHEMLTGKPPALDEPLEEVRSLPPWLAELTRRCLAADPRDRWPDAATALATMSRPSGGTAA